MSIECFDSSCRFHDRQTPYCEQERCIKHCPNCGEEGYIPNKVFNNIANYGSAIINFRCTKCNKVIEAQFKRRTTIATICSKISDKEVDDWGE